MVSPPPTANTSASPAKTKYVRPMPTKNLLKWRNSCINNLNKDDEFELNLKREFYNGHSQESKKSKKRVTFSGTINLP